MPRYQSKKKFMQESVKNGDLNRFKEKAEEEIPTPEPEKFSVRKYVPRFANITAYRLPEDSKVHCADGRELEAQAGDFYVCLDQVQEFVLPAEAFKKLFIVKTEENE